MPNPLCHFEFMTGDVERCRKFYGAVFGWNFDDKSLPGYTLIDTGHEPSGGMMGPEGGPSPRVNVYFKVANIEKVLADATQHGGKLLLAKTPIPGVGHFAMFNDPEGIVVGIMQPDQ